MTEESLKKLLIVEDIQSIREAIVDLLSREYEVFSAENFDVAVGILESEKIDLVITDIRMPGKSGLDLIHIIKAHYPETLYALMTAYNINDYIRFAHEHGVWNIIPKYSFLDIRLILIMVKKLLTKNIFGVEKYFPEDFILVNQKSKSGFEPSPKNGVIFKTITSDKERSTICNKIGKFLQNKGAPMVIQQVLEELTSNAMIRAPRDSQGNSKYQYELPSRDLIVPLKKIQLSENDFFEIGYGSYKETFILVVKDHFGSLPKEEILRRLDRHISVNEETGLPLGLSDSHGRGLYICREVSDHLIFNIHENVQTEIITLIEGNVTKSYKALSIYEV
ncbi:MAG: response regulator [Leptospiraceae bacterium]|nr:response regulator [Leptospiraceae bacterium]MCK6379784.1 response regulator [Leptospiraceae bacterium]NUM42288.1 response regulator [Leptospiraceae bacterium]